MPVSLKTSIVFGPKDFIWQEGQPNEQTETFTVPNPSLNYILRIDNGGTHGQYRRVKDGEVIINGVYVVGQDDKVEVRNVQATSWQGTQWLIEQGLSPGERVVVEGFQKLSPGARVKPVPTVGTEAATGNQSGATKAGTTK